MRAGERKCVVLEVFSMKTTTVGFSVAWRRRCATKKKSRQRAALKRQARRALRRTFRPDWAECELRRRVSERDV